jgi:DNA topoisomerase-1
VLCAAGRDDFLHRWGRVGRGGGLRYVSGAAPGIKRARAGSAFRYFSPDGKPVRDRETLARIKALAIPPAWEKVWICPRADGRDLSDRKLAAIMRSMRDLPGYELFQYIDERGEIRRSTQPTSMHT